MKNVHDVLTAKEAELNKVKYEVVALRVVVGLVAEPGDPKIEPKPAGVGQ